MLVDLLIIAIILIFTVQGWRNGLIASLLGLLGYFGGGVGGLILAKEVTGQWEGAWSLIGTYLLLIFLGAILGQLIAKKIGKSFRNLISPIKGIDALLGSTLGAIKAFFILYYAISLANIAPEGEIVDQVRESQISEKIISQGPPTEIIKELRRQIER
jgi:uncharacterized membrane protein required for colicin V production